MTFGNYGSDNVSLFECHFVLSLNLEPVQLDFNVNNRVSGTISETTMHQIAPFISNQSLNNLGRKRNSRQQ